jgi:hypothetical protein
MRSRFGPALPGVIVAVVLAAAGLAGCQAAGGRKPAGTVASASPSPMPPAVGACYQAPAEVNAREAGVQGLAKVACDQPHVLETYHVGQFPADVAALATMPQTYQPASRAAFADCEAKAKDHLGDDWFTGRVYLVYSRPTITEWDAGARYYRCDLAEVKTIVKPVMVARTGSVRDGLRGARPLASTCHDKVNDASIGFQDLTAVDCAGPHDAEFAGVFATADEVPPLTTDAQETAGRAQCNKLVAAYLGGTPDEMQVSSMFWGWNSTDWARGDKRVRCYAANYKGEPKLKGSVKGIGNRKPPTA